MNLKPLFCDLWLFLRMQAPECRDCKSSRGCPGNELRNRLRELGEREKEFKPGAFARRGQAFATGPRRFIILGDLRQDQGAPSRASVK